MKIRALFTAKERRAAFRRFAGYVLLEPAITVPSRGTFQSAYAGKPPWDSHSRYSKRQPMQSPAQIDAGCGTGENTLFVAARGHVVTGFDFLEEPIISARRKAVERGLAATFLVNDALKLREWTERFDNIIDSGLFHVFSDEDRVQYLEGLKKVLKAERRLFLLCFSNQTQRPRRVSENELRNAFGKGWEIESIKPERAGI
jgi:SAM-dependent methyltransferase